MKPVYVCEGTCAAKISEEDYLAGLTQCGADTCTMKGHAFVKKYECVVCQKVLNSSMPHPHE